MSLGRLTLLALLLVGCATPKLPPTFDKPSVVPIQQSAHETQQHIKKAQDISKRLEQEVPQSKPFVDELNKELLDATTTITTLQGEVTQLDNQLTTQTNKANELSKASASAQVKLTAAVTRYHKLKMLVCGLAAALALFVLLRFPLLLSFIPPPWNVVGFAAIPALVYGGLWLRL
jgi:septal ring factor EnvC (AmiA/AmiB activator)